MHGLELLQSLRSFPTNAPVAVFLRHAQRFPIADQAAPHVAELTPQGMADAEAFGRQIEGFDCVRLFHSPVKRCQQTAECIAKGVTSNGGSAEVVGPENTLGPDYILDLKEAGRLTVQHREHVVRMWFDGQIAPTVLPAAAEIAALKLDYVMQRLRQGCPNGRRLDLHVSHDWNILILRELLCAIRHEDVGWLDYLDGVAFGLVGEELRVMYRDRVVSGSVPWQFS